MIRPHSSSWITDQVTPFFMSPPRGVTWSCSGHFSKVTHQVDGQTVPRGSLTYNKAEYSICWSRGVLYTHDVDPLSIQRLLRWILKGPGYLYPMGISGSCHSRGVITPKEVPRPMTIAKKCLSIDWLVDWWHWSPIEHIMTCSKGSATRLE